MGDEWEQEPHTEAGQPGQDDIDKRIEELRKTVVQGANEAQQRLKRVVDKAGEYWQQTKTPPETPREAKSVEEQRIRQLANTWSAGNWRLARDLGTYMDVISSHEDEVWEITVQTRWESRSVEMANEPYTGRAPGKAQPLLPIWDYPLAAVSGLKAPTTRTRLDGQDDLLACVACNGTGRLLCATCTGRGWIVCPDCQGRMKIRCSTCRGRAYVADWTETKKRPFFQKQAETLANSVTDKVADVFEGIRQQGVPIPNPVDNDPAAKGRTIPCPDCVNGEIECTCGTGKRVCTTCQGAKTEFCAHCSGTGKVLRYREMVRSFTLRMDTRFEGSKAVPEQYLLKASGDLVYSAEIDETFHEDAAPDGVPMDIWHAAVQQVKDASGGNEKLSTSNPMAGSRATLQVLELVRIPFTQVDYHYGNQNYTFYVYDAEGQEKFYADRFPARWDRIERLMRSITTDLMTPAQEQQAAESTSSQARGYRVPVEKPPYTITEEADEGVVE